MVVREELMRFSNSSNQCRSLLDPLPNIQAVPSSQEDINAEFQDASNESLNVDTTEDSRDDVEQVLYNELVAEVQTMEDKICETLERKHNGLPGWISSTLLWLIQGRPQFKEPIRTSKLARLLHSHGFQLLIIITILANIIYIGFRTNDDMHKFMAGHGLHPDLHFTVIETVFHSIYVVEAMMRIYVHGVYFFVEEGARWNVFDLVLILASWIDFFQSESRARNVMFMRVVRFMRVAKVLRVFRVIRFCSEMRVMLDSICDSVLTLVWCILLFVLFLYVFAVLLMQGIISAGYTTSGVSLQSTAKKSFPSVEVSILTLFACITGGDDWINTYNSVSAAGPLEAALFLFYILFFVIVAMNVITSTFLQKASRLFQPDLDQLAVDKHKQILRDVHNFETWVKSLHPKANENLMVTRAQWKQLLQHKEFTHFLAARDITSKVPVNF